MRGERGALTSTHGVIERVLLPLVGSAVGRATLVIIGILRIGTSSLAAQDGYRSRVLDDLLPKLGSDRAYGLELIDSALLELGPKHDPRLEYFLRRYRSEQLYYLRLFDESLVEAERARRIGMELGDSALLSSSLNQVAVLLDERGDDRGGIASLYEALRWFPVRHTYPYPLATRYRMHGNLGRCWADLGQLDSARSNQERSLQMATAAAAPRGAALALLELGRLSQRDGDIDGAMALFTKAITLADSSGIHDVLLDGLADLANAQVRTGHLDRARATLARAHRLIAAHPRVAPRSVLSFHDREVRSLSEAGLYREALVAARTWRTLDSTLRASSARTAQRRLATLHATDAELVNERARAQRAAAELQAEHRLRNTMLVGGALALLMLAAVVVGYVGRSRQKDRLERLALQRAEQEREIVELRLRQQVSEDLHDDLGAGLSALKLHCELAEELASDADTRNRHRTLAGIAGDLIAGMRHMLWSLQHTEASVTDVSIYVADRALAYCAEHDCSLKVRSTGTWPAILADAELRHMAWLVVKDALKVMVKTGTGAPLVLDLTWSNGLAIALSAQEGDTLTAERSALANALSAHHLRIARMGGSLRTTTYGPLRAEMLLPAAFAEAHSASSGSATVLRALLFCVGLHATGHLWAQGNEAFRTGILDSLFTPQAMRAPAADRLRAINAAIDRIAADDDPRTEYHLLMARAKQLYYEGLYDAGISDVNRALTLAQELDDSLLTATTYNMIGLLNENLGNDEVTLPWFRLAARWLPRDTRCHYPVVKSYHIDGNIGQCLLHLDRTDSARYHFQRSAIAAEEEGNLRALALADLGLAHIALRNNRPELAAALLDSARAQALRDGSQDVYVDVLPVLARARMQLIGPAASTRLIDETFEFVRTNSGVTPSSRRNFFKQAGLLREELGQYAAAMDAWRLWQREDSAIHHRDDRAALSTLQVMLDNDKRLLIERMEREHAQAQLVTDREQRRIVVSVAGLSTLLLLGILLLYAGRRRNRARMRVLELERAQGRKELAELQARQRLSEEMHAEIGAGLDALRLRSELALEAETEPDAQERLRHIGTQAAELTAGLRQILWALDPGRSTLSETVLYTAHYARNYLSEQGLNLLLDMDASWPAMELTMEQRRNSFLVVKEALHNVVKHARATQVRLRMTMSDGLMVEIADNGRGVPHAHSASAGNGLRNMRKRIEAIGGRFEMEQASGTVVRFSIPIVPSVENVRSIAHVHT